MIGGQYCKSLASAEEKGVRGDHEALHAQFPRACEGPAEFIIRACLKDMKLESENTCGCLQISGLDLGEIRASGIDEGSNHFGSRQHLVHELEPFCADLEGQCGCTSEVSTGMAQAHNQAELNRVPGDKEDDGNDVGDRLGSECRRGRWGNDDIRVPTDKIGCESA